MKVGLDTNLQFPEWHPIPTGPRSLRAARWRTIPISTRWPRASCGAISTSA